MPICPTDILLAHLIDGRSMWVLFVHMTGHRQVGLNARVCVRGGVSVKGAAVLFIE